MAFDIEGARAAGYSDDEIADHLGSQSNFDTAGARKAGYSSSEILAELTKATVPRPAAPASAAVPAPAPAAARQRGLGDAQAGGLSAVRGDIADNERRRAEGMDPNRMWERRLAEMKPDPVRVEDYGMISPEMRQDLTRRMGAMSRADRLAYQENPRAPAWARQAAVKINADLDASDGGAARLKIPGQTVESRARFLVEQGMRGDVANTLAAGQTQRGAPTVPLAQAAPNRDGLLTPDEEAQARAEGQEMGGRSFAARGFYQAEQGLRTGAAGGMAAALRAMGDDEAAAMYEKKGQAAEVRAAASDELAHMQRSAFETGMRASGLLTGVANYAERMGAGAVNSIGQMAPGIAAAIAGQPGVGMAMMVTPVFGQSYVKAREAGKSPGMAAAYAAPMAALEYVGERYGLLPAAMKALRSQAATKTAEELPAWADRAIAAMEKRGLFSKQVGEIARTQVGEQIGEQITGAGQYLLDGTEFGLSQPVSILGFLENARDTAVQTLMATGAIQAGGYGVRGALGRGEREAGAQGAPVERTDQPGAVPLQPAAVDAAGAVDAPQLDAAAAQRAAPAPSEITDDGTGLASDAGAPAPAPAPKQRIGEDEPPLADGMVRLYHGSATHGRYDGPAWFSTNRRYAADYRDGAELQYVDMPAERINAIADPDGYGQTVERGFTVNKEFDSSETGARRPLLQAAAGQQPAVAISSPVDELAHDAATSPTNERPEPTQAQKEAGNYKVGRARIAGMDISIENPQGSVRRGVSPDGTAWENTLQSHYGYIKGTMGNDKDHVDLFVKPGTPADYAGPVFVVDQVDPNTGAFDEHKVVLGVSSEDEARALYQSNYAADWKGTAAITRLPMAAFKSWVKDGAKRKPLGDLNVRTEEVPIVERRPAEAAAPSEPALAPAGGPEPSSEESEPAAVPRTGGVEQPETAGMSEEAPAPVLDKTVLDDGRVQHLGKAADVPAPVEADTRMSIAGAATAVRPQSKFPPSRDAQALAAARALQRFVDKATGSPGKHQVVAVDVDNASAELRAARALARQVFGQKVVFVEQPNGNLFDGIIHPNTPDTLVLNANSTRPVMAVLGHELLHRLRSTSPGVYNGLKQRLDAVMTSDNAYATKLNAARAARNLKPLDSDVLAEERIADVVGDFFTDRGFWRAMAQQEPSGFRRVAKAVMNFIDDALAKVMKRRPYGTERYIVDLKAARAAVADAMLAFSRAQSTSEAARQTRMSLSEEGQWRDASTFTEARAAASAFQGKTLTNEETGIEATVSRNTLDKMLSAKAVSKSESASAHSRAVANADRLFQAATFGWSKPDRAANTNVVAIHRFFAPMVVGNKALLVKLTVKETVDPNHSNPLYTVEAVELNEESPAAQWVDATVRSDGIDPTSIRSAGDVLSLAEQVQARNAAAEPAAPQAQSNVASAATDDQGNPVFGNDRVRVAFPIEAERFEVIPGEGQRIMQYAVMPAEGFDVLGHVELLMEGAKPVSLLDIEIYPGAGAGRQNGIGRAAVEAILAGTDGDLNISNIVTEARGFWEKLGVPRQDLPDGHAYEGTLNAKTISRRSRDDAEGVRGGTGEAAGGSRREDAGADGVAEAGEAASGEDTEGLSGEGEPRLSLSKDRYSDEEREALARAGLGGAPSTMTRLRGAFGRSMDLLKSRQALADEVRQGTLDQFHGIKRAIEREIGALPVEQDPYIAARLANGGTSSVMRGLMLHGQARWADNMQHLEKVPGTKGLLDILAPLGEDLNAFFGWMVGNRAARLFKEGREHNFTEDQIRTLQGLAKDRKAEFVKIAGEYSQFKRSVLDLAEKAGLIDPVGRASWDHADYIPFYRQLDKSEFNIAGGKSKALGVSKGKRGLAGQSSGIRTLRGGTAALNDPLENLLMNFSRLVDASLKNNAIRKTIDILEEGKSDIIEKTGYAMKGVVVATSQVKQVLEDAGTPAHVLDTIPPEAFEGMAKMWAIQAPTDPDVVRVMRDGKPAFYRVHDPLLLRAVTSFVPFDFPFLGSMRAFKRLLTAMVTAEPAFMIRNLIRDSLAASAIARDGINPAKTLRGIAKSFAESGGYESMLFAGASFQSGNVNAADPAGTAAALRRALRSKGIGAASANKVMTTIIDTPAKFWELYRHAGESLENANREAVYEATAKAGKGATAAAFEAKDLMDFNLRGAWSIYQALADVLPFFNARVQGLYRLGRADPKRLARVGLVLTAASMLLAFLNDGEDWYEELPDYEKDTYWHIRVGGHHFKIPKPFELGVIFATIPERIARNLKELDSNKKSRERLWANVRDQLAFDPVPQMFRPALNVAMNRDSFRDAPIESVADEGKLPRSRYNVRTSETMKSAADMMGPVADATGMSPKRMEYLVSGYLGTVGVYALGASDMLAKYLKDVPPGPEWRPDDFPIVKSFYKVDPARSTVYENDLYKMREELQEIAKSIKAHAREGDLEKVRDLRVEYQDKLPAEPVITEAAKRLSAINKARDRIIADRNLTPAEKRQKIDELQARKNAMAKKVMLTPAVRQAE